jgi:hypothetical protein
MLDNMDNTFAGNVIPQRSDDATRIKMAADFGVLQGPTMLLDSLLNAARKNSAKKNLAKSQTHCWELAKIDA